MDSRGEGGPVEHDDFVIKGDIREVHISRHKKKEARDWTYTGVVVLGDSMTREEVAS